MRKLSVFTAFLLSSFAVMAQGPAATTNVYYRVLGTAPDGSPVGLLKTTEDNLGPGSISFRFVYEDEALARIETLRDGTRVSNAREYEGGHLVRETGLKDDKPTHGRTFKYDEKGRLAHETYTRYDKGEPHQLWTKDCAYDDAGAGALATVTENSESGGRFENVYENGVQTERRIYRKTGELSGTWKYVYDARTGPIPYEEQYVKPDGSVQSVRKNAQIVAGEQVERRPLHVQRTVGDEEVPITHVEITNPYFSPTNSPHRKDDVRIGACLGPTRPLTFEIYDESEPASLVLRERTPIAGGKGFFYFWWTGMNGVGDEVADGRYPFIVRTPVVRAWAVQLWDRRRYTQEPLLCVCGDRVYVYDGVQAKVLAFTPDGDLDREIELAPYPGWGTYDYYPSSLTVLPDGRICLSRHSVLYMYNEAGDFLREIVLDLDGYLPPRGWAVDEDGSVYCVVGNTLSIAKAGKRTYYDDYAVLKLDDNSRVERVVVDGSGLYPDATSFVRRGTLYVNFWRHADKESQRYLGVIDLASGAMKLLPRTEFANDVMSADAGDLYVQGGAMFRDPVGRLVRGFGCGSDCAVLSGNTLYAMAEIGTELRRYDLDSDRILLEEVLVVDNTTPTAIITYPGSMGLVAGDPDVVEITGTATDLNFEKYEIYWKYASNPREDRSAWKLLITSDAPCAGGTLALWDTTKLGIRGIKDRDIALKLIVTDKAGNTIEERFSLCYDADDDGFSNEFENSSKELDRNAKTERRTAEVLPDLITMLTRRYPINGQGRIGVQLVDAETREVLDHGLIEFSVNTGTIVRRSRISASTLTATATWQTPSSVVAPATLHVELPPQGIHNVYYTAEPMEMDFALVVDSDFDGLTDDEENTVLYPNGLKTSPTNADTDGDGVDDYRDLSPTVAPDMQFAEEYAPGEIRLKQTYRIVALAGSEAKVIKNDRNLGRDAIMDKDITDETVKDFFNDKVFRANSKDESERSPLHVETATNKQTFAEENICNPSYTAAAGWPHYEFKYYLEQYLYDLTVTNERATTFPVESWPKYGHLQLDVTWRWEGDNAIVVQFKLGNAGQWRDQDANGNSTKMFMRYELFKRGNVAKEFPHYTGLAAVDRVEGDLYQCIIRVPFRTACPTRQAIGSDQTIVLTPLWVRHKGGNFKCGVQPKVHPEITPDLDECPYCGYRPVRDEFVPVSTRDIRLSAFAHQFNHYSYCVIGRRSARAGGPPVDSATDYDTLTAIFDHFHPAQAGAPHPANGLVPFNIGGRSHNVLFCEYGAVPGIVSSEDFDPAQFVCDNMQNADAVVVRSNSAILIDCWISRLQYLLAWEGLPWAAEWILIPQGGAAPSASTGETVGTDEQAEAQADSALDTIGTVGARLKTIRETAEFVVDCSNLQLIERADTLASPTTIGTMQVGNSIYNVVAEKLGDNTFEVQLQHTQNAVGDKLRYRTTLVRKEEVDDITDSKIAQQYGVVNKLPKAILTTVKIGTVLMTDGVDAYQAWHNGEYFEACYHGVRGGAKITLSVISVAWKNSPLLKTVQITKFAKFNVTEAVVAGIEVTYHVINAVRADTWLERSQAVEKAVAATIDGAIGCIEPYGAAITLSWDASVWATNKVCDKFGFGESTAISREATSSIGAALVFLFEDLSPFGIPTVMANDAYTTAKDLAEEKVRDTNTYLDDRNRDDPRWVFVPPDAPKD
ncbi:MAG: hypothetical protein JW889_08050 [Verrucomicrobia bacterium]|nr:hypothetical protein [Verrucomicrobiota bacterium]